MLKLCIVDMYFRCLGDAISTVELNTMNMSEADLKKIEDKVNSCIRQQISVDVKTFHSKDDPLLAEVSYFKVG